MAVIWAPQPGPQHALIDCPVPEILFGGARGGGKSDGVLGKYAIKALRYGAGFNGVFFRKEMPQSDDLIERSREIYAPLGGKFDVQKTQWRFPTGARLRFRPLENVAAAEKYQGQNLSDVAIEEAGNYTSSEAMDRLWGALRSKTGVPVQMVLTANPGGPGQFWIKSRYIDPAPRGMRVLKALLPDGTEHRRVFIPSKVEDNRALLTHDPGYISRLYLVGSAALVKAWLEGDWSAVQGAFFDKWSMARNVVKPFVIPREWTRMRAFDWGSAKPFSVGWWAVASDNYRAGELVIPRGCLVRYREWYGSNGTPNVGLKLTAEQVAAGILEREKPDLGPEGKTLLRDFVADPSIFSEDGGPSIGERMARAGVRWRPADNARVARNGAMGGWDQMRARIDGDEDGPMLVVFDTCVDFTRTIPVLQHDPNRAEDLDTNAEDHIADECFAGETQVLTPDGPVAFESLPQAGEVIGPDGRPTTFAHPRIINSVARLVRLFWSSGEFVDCTEDHKFLTESGWCAAIDLCGREVLSASPSSVRRFRSSRASATTAADFTFSARASDFIARCGNVITARCQKVTWSIMRIMIGRTIRSRTSTCWPPSITPVTTLVGLALASAQSRSPSKPLGLGMAPLTERRGIGTITSETYDRSLRRNRPMPASNAESHSKRPRTWRLRSASVTKTAKPKLCVAVEPLNERRPVWCLTVPEWGAFALANGAIVQNCRYACMSRPMVAKQVVKPNNPPDLWTKKQPGENDWKTI